MTSLVLLNHLKKKKKKKKKNEFETVQGNVHVCREKQPSSIFTCRAAVLIHFQIQFEF